MIEHAVVDVVLIVVITETGEKRDLQIQPLILQNYHRMHIGHLYSIVGYNVHGNPLMFLLG